MQKERIIMKKMLLLTVLTVLVFVGYVECKGQTQSSIEFQISKADLMDKIKGGWAGQVIGVCYALPTEFKYQKIIIPELEAVHVKVVLLIYCIYIVEVQKHRYQVKRFFYELI